MDSRLNDHGNGIDILLVGRNKFRPTPYFLAPSQASNQVTLYTSHKLNVTLQRHTGSLLSRYPSFIYNIEQNGFPPK